MADIHPTATIDPRAELAPSVSVGPYCTIEGRVTIGPGTRLHAHAHLQGPLTLGADNDVYHNVYLGFPPQDRGFSPDREGAGCVVGDRNVFRQGTSIDRATRAAPTTVGNDNFFMVNTHAGHDCRIGDHCTFANGALLGGHVEVADRVTLGGNAVVHQHCRVGRLSMMSGVMGITQDLPPFCVVYNTRSIASLNLVALRRAGLREHIAALTRAFNLYCLSKLPNDAVVQMMLRELGGDPLVREFADFIRTTRRGVLPHDPTAGRALRGKAATNAAAAATETS